MTLDQLSLQQRNASEKEKEKNEVKKKKRNETDNIFSFVPV